MADGMDSGGQPGGSQLARCAPHGVAAGRWHGVDVRLCFSRWSRCTRCSVKVTGLNGKTDDRPAVYRTAGGDVAVGRAVRVQFLAVNNGTMPWQFRAPQTAELRVTPGAAPVHLTYYARNESDRDMVAQAVPSVSPGRAAKYLRKIECFCFQRQPLAAGEASQLPLRFYLDPDLPEDIGTITLSYTLFDVSELAAADAVAADGTPR